MPEFTILDSYSPVAIREKMIKDESYRNIVGSDATADKFSINMVQDMLGSVKEALYTGYTVDAGSEVATFSDLIGTRSLTRFVEASIVDVIRASIEPNLVVVPNLFSRVDITGPVPSIRINTIGPVRIHELAEGADYKESGFELGEDMQRIDLSVKKYGGLVRITQEALEMNMVDLIRMWLQKMGTSMAQFKEKVGIDIINKFGKVVFDGANPAQSVKGSPSGRGIDGAANGTMSLYDFFDLYAHLTLLGFNPDTLLINPMAWKMFMTDPETREIFLKNGVLSGYRMPAGSYASGWGTSFGGFGERMTGTGNPGMDPTNPALKLGVSAYGTSLAENHNLAMLGNTFNIPPSNQFPGPLKVIVTPHVGYRKATTPDTYVTDIYLIDSQNCGVLGQKELPTVSEFTDPWRDIQVTKVHEKFGFAILEQGKSIAIAKNIVIGKNYVFENSNSVTLKELNSSAARVTL